MTLFSDNQTILANSDTVRLANNQSRVTNVVDAGNASVEKEEISQRWTSVFAKQRELTPEELRRVEFLKNTLVQTLTMAQGDPTEDQKKQIREVEAELEKLTGVKMRSRISTITDKMPKRDDDEDEDAEKRKRQQQTQGIDPQEAAHNNADIKTAPTNPGMQMLRRSAYIGGLSLSTVMSETTSTTPSIK